MKDWTESERERQDAVLAGKTVVANVRKGADEALVAWGKGRRTLRLYRTADARRLEAVRLGESIQARQARRPAADHCCYREHLDHSPALKLRLPELRGKVLGCWCHPEPCHGDVLCEAVN